MSATLTPYERVHQAAEQMGRAERENAQGFRLRCPVASHGSGRGDVISSAQVWRRKDGGVTVKCQAGCDEADIYTALGLIPEEVRPAAATATGSCTLEQLAAAKGFPIDFLEGLGLATTTRQGVRVVSIPHRDESGEVVATMYRLCAEPRDVRWKQGEKQVPYGLWRMADARATGRCAVVEGQTDCMALWLAGEPALGLPGAGGWNARVEAALEGVDKLHVVVEPDKGGETLLKAISASRLRGRIRVVRLDGAKDPCALRQLDPERFAERSREATNKAPRLVDILDKEREARLASARERCADLLRAPDILKEFDRDVSKFIAGETRSAKLTYLALTSRVLRKPVSVLARGPSSAGKSHMTGSVLKFLPPEAFRALTAMSARALVFTEESFAHRFVVLYEAAGMNGTDDTLAYVMRSLLSEGRIAYDVTEKDENGRLTVRHIEKEGPTGLLLTTTKASVDEELETRLLSLGADDSQAQTRAVIEHVSKLAAKDSEPEVDFARWHALQEVVAASPARVAMPFARALGKEAKPAAVRMRRDIDNVFGLVRAHALLHAESRTRDKAGRVVATIEGDYAAVHELYASSIGEAAGKSVPEAVKGTRNAVEDLFKADGTGCSVTALAKKLEIDKAAASHRVRKAVTLGYVVNQNAGARGKPYSLVPGESLPAGDGVLPTPDELRAAVSGADDAEPEPDEFPEPEPAAPKPEPEPRWSSRTCPACGGQMWRTLDAGGKCTRCFTVVDRKGVVLDAR